MRLRAHLRRHEHRHHRPSLGLQKRFVAEFLEGGNGTQAYTRAGYSTRSAQPSASRLLRDPRIEAVAAAGRQRMAQALEVDATLAQSKTQAQASWKIRESHSEAQKIESPSIKHDICAGRRIPSFIERGIAAMKSAEHGIGRFKLEELGHYRSPVELDVMRSIKRALDPRNLMSPGIVVHV